ncbi:cardiolipin synthase [Paraphotobacterium marinum]|uniref:cardiolipin synthase n=1 Tax=Paraphotobacterium marinum TaxID=1755811 RepID=UPI0039E9754F
MEKIYQVITWLSLFSYWLLLAFITVRIIFKRREVSSAFAWLLIIYIIPLFGLIIYLLIGELGQGYIRNSKTKLMFFPYIEWFRKLKGKKITTDNFHHDSSSFINKLCLNKLFIPSLTYNNLEILNHPNNILSSILKDIRQSKSFIHFEFYIWSAGGVTNVIAQELIKSSSRGVKVRILLDAAGSRKFFKTKWPQIFQSNNIEIKEALKVQPLRMFFRRLDYRQHRKIIVIDNEIGYTGSMNMIDPRYFKKSSHVGQWIDLMVRMKGPAVYILHAIQSWDWEIETNQRILKKEDFIPINKDYLSSVQVIPSGPMFGSIISQVLVLAIHNARNEITITTPYFVPSDRIIHALKTAGERCIKVNIIIPNKNDSIMVEWASRAFFEELLMSGVRIFRYTEGLLHTKSVVIDNNLSLVGTVNIDVRSLQINDELTLAIEDSEFTKKLNSIQQEYIRNSIEVSEKSWKKRSFGKKVLEQFFYLFSPLL